MSTLDTARIPLQIDIGFGDAIIPTPLNIDYPAMRLVNIATKKSRPIKTIEALL
jgi:hypothetical protein